MERNTHKSNISRDFLKGISDLLDSRIAEVNQKLMKGKLELMEQYEKMVNEEDFSDNDIVKIDLNDFNLDNLVDIKTIEKMKELKNSLDDQLKSYEVLFKINERFQGDLSKIINLKKNEIGFIPYKLKRGLSECIWNTVQFKKNHVLSNEQQSMKVNYKGCYEAYTSETTFEEGLHKVNLDVTCVRTTEWHSIGLVNENYNDSFCICLKSDCFFMVKKDGTNFNGGDQSNPCGFTFNDRIEPYRLEYEINLEDPQNKSWKFNFEGTEYGPFKLTGNKFRIAAGMCNGGEVNYVLNA